METMTSQTETTNETEKTTSQTETTNETEKTTPMIYVACLSSYVEGSLYGKWVDATQTVEGMQAEIKKMLASSPLPNAEEYTIHDCDNFESYTVGEQTDLTKVHEVACLIVDHPFLGTAVMDSLGCTTGEAIERIDCDYRGCYGSLGAYAKSCFDDCDYEGMSQILMDHVDYEKMGRHFEAIGEVSVIEDPLGGVHIFHNNN